jgi:D-3-phosphoglycerate dehydrogenase / 2-oxoglutarate reductase
MKILLLNAIDPEAIEELGTRYEVTCAFGSDWQSPPSLIHQSEVLVFRSGVTLSQEVIRDALRLRLLVRAGSGVDNVDLDEVRRRGIRFVRIPGPGAQAVAEMTFALLLDLARRVSLADRFVRRGRWPKPQLVGSLTRGKTLGVVGLGNIGTRVGELGVRWGMRVIGCVEYPSLQRAERFADQDIALLALDEVVAQADFLTIHVPLKDSTRYLIDGKVLARMKSGAYLINIARGGIVEEEALSTCLDSGRLAGVALDVHEREGEGIVPDLARHQNVVLTPHIGAMAAETQRAIGRRVLKLIDGFATGAIEAAIEDGELVV